MVDRAIYEREKAQLQQQEAAIRTPLKRPAFTSRTQREYQRQFLGASKEYQKQQELVLKSQEQKQSIEAQLASLKKQFEDSTRRWKEQKWDKSVRRKEQALQKNITVQMDLLREAKSNIDKGFVYSSTGELVSIAEQAGRQRQSQEEQMFSSLEQRKAEKQKFAESAGFKSYDEMVKLSKVTSTGDGLRFEYDSGSFIGEGGKKVTVQEFTEVPGTSTTQWVDEKGQPVSYDPKLAITRAEAQQNKLYTMITQRPTYSAFDSLIPYSPPVRPTFASKLKDVKEDVLNVVLTPETRLGIEGVKSTKAYKEFLGPETFGIQTISFGQTRGDKSIPLLAVPIPSFGSGMDFNISKDGKVRTQFITGTDVGKKIAPEVGAGLGFSLGAFGNLFDFTGVSNVKAITSTAEQRAIAREKRMKTGEVYGRIAGESLGGLVPTTVGEAAVLGAIGFGFKAIPGVVSPMIIKTFGTGKKAVAAATAVPQAAQFGISGLFGYQGAKIALNKELTPGERGTGFLVGGLGALGMASIGVPYFKNIKAKKGLTKLPEPALEDKPFLRKTPGGKTQEVFYERYTGFDLFNVKTYKPTFKNINEFELFSPSTWKSALTSQAKGTFLERQYRISDPLVDAKLLGLTEQTYYRPVGKRIVKVTEPTTPFPFDNPKVASLYFKGRKSGVEQYYLPKTFKGKKQIAPSVLRELNAFGFSASPQPWEGTKFGPDVLKEVRPYGGKKIKIGDTLELPGAYQFYSAKGISKSFLGLGGEGEPMQLGYNFFGGSPVVYAGRFRGVQRNPAIVEVVGKSESRGGARTKVYLLRNKPKPGLIQTPEYKMEQEGVITFTERTPLRNIFYTQVQGRVVPIIEQTVSGGGKIKSLLQTEGLDLISPRSSYGKSSAYKSPLELYSFQSSKVSRGSPRSSSFRSSVTSSFTSSLTPSKLSSASRTSSKLSSSLSSSLSPSLSSSLSRTSYSKSKTSKPSQSYSSSSSIISPIVSPPPSTMRYKSRGGGGGFIRVSKKKKRSYLLTPTGFEAAIFGTQLRRKRAAKPLYEITGFEAERLF